MSSAWWNGLRGLARQGLNSAAFFGLATFLTPNEFGMGSIAVAAGMLGRLVLDRGLRNATIQTPNLSSEYLETAWTLNALLGVLLACIFGGIGWGIAAVFRKSALGWLIAAAGGLPLLAGLSSVAEGYLEREFRQRQLGFAQALSSAFGGGLALLLAWRGAGAWSLLALNMGECAALVVSTNVLAGGISRIHVDLEMARKQIAFVWPIAAANVLYGALPRVALLAVGSAFGSAAAAQFRVGFQVYQLLVQVAVMPIVRALLPVMSHHDGDLRSAYTKVVSAYAGFCAPVFFGAAAICPIVIQMTLGDKWIAAGNLGALMCFAAVGGFACQPLEAALVVVGNSRSALALALWDTAIGLVMVGGGAAFSVYGVAAGLVVQGVAGVGLAATFSRHHLGSSAWGGVAPVVLYSLAGLVTFATARLILLESGSLSSVAAVGLATLGGVAAYFGLVRIGVRRIAPTIYWSAANILPIQLRVFM